MAHNGTSSFNPAARRRARHYALQALYQWLLTRDPLHDIEAQFLASYDFSVADLPFFHSLLHSVPARASELDAHFASYLDRPLRDLDPVELCLLRMGTWELAERIDIPCRVAISEYVGLAKKFGATDSHKYINGVLDRVARECRKPEFESSGRA